MRRKNRQRRTPLHTIGQLFIYVSAGWVQVRYLRENPDNGRLALLVLASVMFGVVAAQLPFLKKWLDHNW